MRLAIFSTKKWVRDSFSLKKPKEIEITFLEARLDVETASLAKDYEAICVFVNDNVNKEVIDILARGKTKIIALRCAGFNNVDLDRAEEKGLTVVRVPEYSPYAVAEHAVGLILSLNRKFHRSHNRIREGNFSLDGLLGFDIRGKTLGVIGTGKIGRIFIGIMQGFGCTVVAYDKFPSQEMKDRGVEYVELDELYRRSDIISLHCPLIHETYHIINEFAINSMKEGVMIINSSRGPLINTNAVIDGLKTGKIGYLGLDVYEEEGDLFFEDLSEQVIQDDTFVRLQTFPNVLITSHQAFFTKEAVENIRDTTYSNLKEFVAKGSCSNAVSGRKG